MHRINDVPILQAIHEDTTVKWVIELAFWGLEVSVPMVVGFFIGGEVFDHLGELGERNKGEGERDEGGKER